MKLKFTRIILFVKDVPNVSKFYIDAFGIKAIGGIDYEWTELEAGGLNIAFHKTSNNMNKRNNPKVKIVFAQETYLQLSQFWKRKE